MSCDCSQGTLGPTSSHLQLEKGSLEGHRWWDRPVDTYDSDFWGDLQQTTPIVFSHPACNSGPGKSIHGASRDSDSVLLNQQQEESFNSFLVYKTTWHKGGVSLLSVKLLLLLRTYPTSQKCAV